MVGHIENQLSAKDTYCMYTTYVHQAGEVGVGREKYHNSKFYELKG
jgi:hypothetical protein